MQFQLTNMLDVAIVLAGLYVGLSTFCSFCNEQIAVAFQLRGRKLVLGVANLVHSRTLANAVFAHAALDSTVNDKGGIQRPSRTRNRPSYADPHSFALAFWDVLADAVEGLHPASARAASAVSEAWALVSANNNQATQSRLQAANELLAQRNAAVLATGTGVLSPSAHFEDLRQVVESLPINGLKATTLQLLAQSQDYDELLTVTGAWFSRQMDSVTGWYTRQAAYVLIVLALLITFVTGFDSLEIAQSLYTAPAIVSNAANQLNAAIAPGGQSAAAAATAAQGVFESNDFRKFFHPFFDAIPPLDKMQSTLRETNEARDGLAVKVAEADDRFAKNKLHDDQVALERVDPSSPRARELLAAVDADVLRGQSAANALDAARKRVLSYTPFSAHAIGWFITVLAISLGAPFWFDLLNRLINVRGAGPKPSTPPG